MKRIKCWLIVWAEGFGAEMWLNKPVYKMGRKIIEGTFTPKKGRIEKKG